MTRFTNFIRAAAVLPLFAGGCLIGDDPQDTDVIEAPPGGSGNAAGWGDTFFSAGQDPGNAFFQSLGTNGRTCQSCHRQAQGWSITPAELQARFDATEPDGIDPVFRTNDGSNSPNANVSNGGARRAAYSMLLTKGLIRVGIGVPAGADFTLIAVDDPYGYASAAELSLFRRPLPSTNIFLPTVMWDGRLTFDPADISRNLHAQSIDATLGHAQAAAAPTMGQQDAIVNFQLGIFTTQIRDRFAGDLDTGGARGGPQNLANEDFFVGINDPLGGNPQGTPFNPRAFTLFDAWGPPANAGNTTLERRRASIFRGQEIFNTRPINISGVRGLNDVLGVPSITGTCTICHDTPNIGNHSVPLPIDIGLSDASRRTADMPLYTFRNNATGETIQSTDPGRALITGRFADINKFKGPILRGLAMRAPYFHNGSAATLEDAITFYDVRFGLGLSAQEKADLAAFLKAL